MWMACIRSTSSSVAPIHRLIQIHRQCANVSVCSHIPFACILMNTTFWCVGSMFDLERKHNFMHYLLKTVLQHAVISLPILYLFCNYEHSSTAFTYVNFVYLCLSNHRKTGKMSIVSIVCRLVPIRNVNKTSKRAYRLEKIGVKKKTNTKYLLNELASKCDLLTW